MKAVVRAYLRLYTAATLKIIESNKIIAKLRKCL